MDTVVPFSRILPDKLAIILPEIVISPNSQPDVPKSSVRVLG